MVVVVGAGENVGRSRCSISEVWGYGDLSRRTDGVIFGGLGSLPDGETGGRGCWKERWG